MISPPSLDMPYSSSPSQSASSQVDLIRSSVDLNRTSLLFESNSQTRIVKILYCNVDNSNMSRSSQDSCPFYVNSNRLESLHGFARFRTANVLLKLNENTSNYSRYVNLVVTNTAAVVTPEISNTIRIVPPTDVDEYPILIARPALLSLSSSSSFTGEYSLTQNERESICFSVNRTTGWISMNCIDTNANNDDSVFSSDTTLTVTLKQADLIYTAVLRVHLVTESYDQRDNNLVLEYAFTESVLDDARVDELIRNEGQINLDSLRTYLSHHVTSNLDNASLPSSVSNLLAHNSTHVLVALTFANLTRLPAPGTPLYRLEPNVLFNSRSIFLLDSIESTHLRMNNILDGLLYLAADLEVTQWSDQPVVTRLDARVGLIETNLIDANSHQLRRELQLEIIVNLSGSGVQPPRPSLATNIYDVEIDRDRLEKNRDYETLRVELIDVAAAFNVDFEIKTDYADYDFPFYVQQSTLLFSSHSTHRSLKSAYRFKMVAKFRLRNSNE